MLPPPNYGATPHDWLMFADMLGLRADLLPVVSNPNAVIDPSSSLSALGKVPSRYTRAGTVAGIPEWTTKSATKDGVAAWASNPDYGICLQTRNVRAIDVDIPDKEESATVRAALAHLGLPVRSRKDSSKFLMAFAMPGEHPKRAMRTAKGLIEFLANGQQFVVAGTHPGGNRYEWEGGVPYSIPELSAPQFEELWAMLTATFATSSPTVGKVTTRVEKYTNAAQSDEVAEKLIADGWVLAYPRSGALDITCPFADTHTGASAASATTYFPAHTGGYATGNFKCLHAHCAGKTQDDFRMGVGIEPPAMFDDETNATNTPENVAIAPRFLVHTPEEFTVGEEVPWLIKGVLPQAEFAMVYGPPSSGKSFFALDMVGAICRDGVDWRGLRTQHGKCVYIAAEGAGGFRKRVRAYAKQHAIPLSALNLGIIGDAPNLLSLTDVDALARQIQAFSDPVRVIVVDTLSAAMLGNENDSEDVGRLIRHCKELGKRTGGMVILVHHSGKDGARGERGSSAFRGASDCSIEVSRDGEDRCATIVKQKDGDDSINAAHGFTLAVVEIGMDADGDPITSCACVAATVPVKAAEIDVEQSVLVVIGKGSDKGVYIKDLELLIPGVSARKIKAAVAALKLVGSVTDYDGMVKIVL